MIRIFARLHAPIAGLGKASIVFSKRFRKLHPERRKIMLEQCMKAMRAEHKRAEIENLNLIKAEDARNADLIQPAQSA